MSEDIIKQIKRLEEEIMVMEYGNDFLFCNAPAYAEYQEKQRRLEELRDELR